MGNKQTTESNEEKKNENSEGGRNTGEDNEEEDRPQWSNHSEFLLSVIGYAVGLGNVWRFPYQAYKHGGGAFLVCYWILSALVGFPLILLEQSLGQYGSQGPMHAFNYAPLVRGIGWCMTALSSLACIYYNIIIAWALYYMFASFQSVLPFSSCAFDSWATYLCELKRSVCNLPWEIRAMDGLCYFKGYISYFQANYQVECFPGSQLMCMKFLSEDFIATHRNEHMVIGYWNETIAAENGVSPKLSTEEYFTHQVLGMWPEYNTENIGTPRWGLALSLLLGWILVYLSLLNGIKSAGKVVYFTALFPYVIIIILIGRGVTLDGAYDGIMFYLRPDWKKLRNVEVWLAAANQLFFSLGAGWGGMVALSSYNKFKNNILRDAVITVLADSLTSFIAGFAIFSVIGHGAYLLEKPIDQVADAGTGLAFVMYPKILLALPASVFWSILFFFMLLLLGLDSEFNTMETVLTSFYDTFPWFRATLKRKALFMGVLCSIFYLLGLPMVCNGGSTLVDVVDSFSSSWGALLIGVFELLSISWLYGTSKFHQDLKLMIQWGWTTVGRWYIFAFWGIISPFILLLILFYSWVIYKPNADLTTTDEGIGWCCTIFVLIWLPVFALYELLTTKGTILERLKITTSPTRKWGPFLVKYRREVTHLGPDFDIDPRGKLGSSPGDNDGANDLKDSMVESVKRRLCGCRRIVPIE